MERSKMCKIQAAHAVCILFILSALAAVLSCGNSAKSGYLKPKSAVPAYAEPHVKPDGSKYAVAVVFSGEYWEFFENCKALIQGLASIGWARPVFIPDTVRTGRELISLAEQSDFSDCLHISEALFFDMEWGTKPVPSEIDADIILAYGGMAARYFYDLDQFAVPVLIDAVTDPLALGITKSVSDSGKNHISCKIDTEQFRNQIRLFHELTGFKKLGIIYGDTEYGRVYGAVRDIEACARELGFTIIRNTDVPEYVSDSTVPMYLAALEQVTREADAVYIGASTAVTEYDCMDEIAEILIQASCPSFALEGSRRVEQGILFGMGSSSFTRSGIYMALKIAAVCSGIPARKLDQLFENAQAVAVNADTAKRMGFKIPMDVLLAADEIYYIQHNGENR